MRDHSVKIFIEEDKSIAYSPLGIINSHTLFNEKAFHKAAPSTSFGANQCQQTPRKTDLFKGWTNWKFKIQSAESEFHRLCSDLQMNIVYMFPHHPHMHLQYYNESLHQIRYNISAFAVSLNSDLHLRVSLDLLPNWRGAVNPINETVFLSRHPVIYRDDFIADIPRFLKYIPMPDFALVEKSKFRNFMHAVWEGNLEQSRGRRDMDNVKFLLEAAAGVYSSSRIEKQSDKTFISSLERTVLLVYFEPLGEQEFYLRNVICYAKHYGLKLVIYVNSRKYKDHYIHIDSWTALHPEVYVIDYPYEVLWSNLLKQNSDFHHEGQLEYFRTYLMQDVPSIKEFCDLMKFIAISEVLSFNFDVLYIDTDLVFLTDPIAYLMQGNADISLSVEMRNSQFPTLLYLQKGSIDGWKDIEPNNGLMRIRATKKGKLAVATWINVVLSDCLFQKACTCCQIAFKTVVDSLRYAGIFLRYT